MVSHHLLGKSADVLVLRFVQSLLGGLDVKLAGGVGDVGNLRIGGFCRLVGRDRSRGEHKRARKGTDDDTLEHDVSFRGCLPKAKRFAEALGPTFRPGHNEPLDGETCTEVPSDGIRGLRVDRVQNKKPTPLKATARAKFFVLPAWRLSP